jgi:hypothetical protein
VGFSCEGRECCCDLADAGPDVGGRGVAVTPAARVACVGSGDCVAEVALNPGECGVPEPVGADLLGCYPGKLLA